MSTPLTQWLDATPDERGARLEAARREADATTRSHGVYINVASEPRILSPTGELANVPFAVKDNIDVAGLPTTNGSPLLGNVIADVDANIVSALREAGAIVIGKTNMHELAFGVTSDNATFGPVRNPVDPARSAGGSSGGSAATVALGTVPFSLGTDTGGSVCIPASFCGIVGFRPSTGRYPGDGVVNLSWSRDTIGIHARAVADVETIDAVITRCRPDKEATNRLRIGIPRNRYDDLAPEVRTVADQTLKAFAEAGVDLVDVVIDQDLQSACEPGTELVRYEAPPCLVARAAGTNGHPLDVSFPDLVPHVASPDVRTLAQGIAARPVSRARYERARTARWRLRRAYQAMFAESAVDAILAPSVHVLPPPLGQAVTIKHNGRTLPLFETVTRNAAPGTVAGVPMLSLPAGASATGLPIGMCLEGRFFDDVHLLRVGRAAEEILSRTANVAHVF